MVSMNSQISIGAYVFPNCNSFQVRSSWKTIAKTATIKMHNIAGMLSAIKVGDKVVIEAGYDDDYQKEFSGYVSEVNPSIPVEIKCEDEMWALKQQTVSMSWRSTTLKTVLKFLVPNANIECPEVTLAPFRLDNVTKAKALQKLKDEYLLTVYFRNGLLFVGLPYTESNLPTVSMHFQKNAKAEGLTFKRKEDLKIKVKAISILPNNTRIEKEFGDSDGDSTTLHFYNKKESELKALAEEAIGRMKYDGYKGSFRTIGGYPFVDHGYKANLFDDNYPERQQGVFVDTVTTDYGPEGYHRTIEPGRKVKDV